MIEFETLHGDTVTTRPGAILFIVRQDDHYSLTLGSNGGVTSWEIDQANYDTIRAMLMREA